MRAIRDGSTCNNVHVGAYEFKMKIALWWSQCSLMMSCSKSRDKSLGPLD